MRRAAWGTVLFFFVAPATVGGLVPWLLAGEHDPAAPAAVAAGVLLVVAGLVVLVACFVRFVREGGGTPAPVAPTRELVVGGVYRFVRNPMYLAVGAVIAGQALMFASLAVLVWLVIFAVAVVSLRGRLRAAHPALHLWLVVRRLLRGRPRLVAAADAGAARPSADPPKPRAGQPLRAGQRGSGGASSR